MKLQRLIDKSVSTVRVITPVSDKELIERENDYMSLSKNRFSKKYNKLTYKPVELTIDDKKT